MSLLFVYGTLQRGGAGHRMLAGQAFVGRARTRAIYRLYQLDGYPGLVSASPGRSIEGELWRVDPECLARLDRWEGTAVGLYARTRVALRAPHDGLSAETYVYRRSVAGRADLGSRFGASTT